MEEAKYPKREKFHAMKLTRLLLKSCAAQTIGRDACLLVAYIASTEDAARYQYPVKFWNSQLDNVLGFKSRKQLTDARKAAIDAGWLHYRREHDRAVGEYWTKIPPEVQRFDDLPVEDSRSVYGTQTTDSRSAGGTQTADSCSAGGAHSGSRNGSPSYPLPIPKRKECHDLGSRDASESSTKRKKAFTDADRQTASWMAEQLRQTNPDGRKKSAAELDAWANDIRLIRERDGKSDSDIRSLFSWANRDEFWSSNILSPGKLRKQWDQLTAKRKSSGKTTKPADTFTGELLPVL
jgi:hypothetical protein